jgi:CRISPR-associated protein Cmr5
MTQALHRQRTLDQRRAEHARETVEEILERGDAVARLYRSYVERFGPAVVMNGLGQALATELAAAGRAQGDRSPQQVAHEQLYKNVMAWLCGDAGVYTSGSDLLTELVAKDQAHYVRAQAEALTWLNWHKKFCQALLPKAKPGEGDDE